MKVLKERILFVVILFFGIGIGFFGWKIWKSGSVRIQEPVFVEEWSKAVLRNAQNLEIPLNKIPGKLKLVYFGFSHCPDMCPRALMDMSLAIKELGEEGKNLTPVFISVDPERDSPELLAKYVKQFPEERLIALTGEKRILILCRMHSELCLKKSVRLSCKEDIRWTTLCLFMF